MKVLSGMQPSGSIHIGNYLGALKPFLGLQQEHKDTAFFIADYHSLTTLKDKDALKQNIIDMILGCKALGINTIYKQSDLPQVTEFCWILSNLITTAELERCHAFKAAEGNVNSGTFMYPVLMAADILLNRAEFIPVGKDQTQHVELARDWAQKYNNTFLPTVPLTLPTAKISNFDTIPGTDNNKMSKSRGNIIEIFGDIKQIEKSIKLIVTDSKTPDEPKHDTSGCLYQLLMALAQCERDRDDYSNYWIHGGKGYGWFKEQLIACFHAEFDRPRAEYERLKKDPNSAYNIVLEGRDEVSVQIYDTMFGIREAVGLEMEVKPAVKEKK
jgi:tryptophanyl-tRNA synthetase